MSGIQVADGVLDAGGARYVCCIVTQMPPPWHHQWCILVQIVATLTGQDKVPFVSPEPLLSQPNPALSPTTGGEKATST